MAKPGRNEPCPCGSGNKYKKCCLAKDAAAEQAEREGQATARQRRERELEDDVAAWLQRAEAEDRIEDDLDDASNAVVDLVKGGKLVQILQNVLSADGNTLNISYTSTDAKGETKTTYATYERVVK